MKRLFALTLLLTGAVLAGCASPHQAAATPPAIVTPDDSQTATVAMYDTVGRFVVLNFPSGLMPKDGQLFFIYRSGLKVGEAKITGPVRDNSIVADLVGGEAQSGDEVRDQ